ncbi:hypothetical protein GYA54_00310 [Candidatus Kuenenbacteria bacterium]|nr:hypothetical protein [Candidatus Kuenenbacteria bacterium]
MNIFVFGDTHNCSEEDLYLASKKARDFECQTIIHTGDLADQHWGHPAFDDFQMYVFVTKQNEKIPEKLPNNWHLLREKVACIITIGGMRIYVNHYLGLRALKFKDRELLEHVDEAEIWKVNEEIMAEYGYVNYVLFGHSHHTFHHCDRGMAMLNPGEWETKKTFIIIHVGDHFAMDFRVVSLTINQVLVDK